MLKRGIWSNIVQANKIKSRTVKPIKAKPYNPNTLDNMLNKLYKAKNNL